MARRDIPEINAGSMADIAFLLLVFFLVATTMDTDMGLIRILPQPIPEDVEPPEIRERNIMVVLINRSNQIMVEGEVIDIRDLRTLTTEFLTNPYNSDDLPEKREKDIEFLGEVPVTKGVISLQTDRATSYELFIAVLNELTAAGNEIKDKLGRKYFDMPYEDLPKDKRDAILEAAPCIISEAEPKDIGGNR